MWKKKRKLRPTLQDFTFSEKAGRPKGPPPVAIIKSII